jgi:hypothetical protein
MVLRASGGLAVALPLMAHADPAPAPKRFVFCYQPNGVYVPQWSPTAGATESDFTMGPIHQSLVPYKQHLLFLSGLDMKVAVNGAGEQHQRGIGAVLTGSKINTGNFVGNDGTKAGWGSSISLDQQLVSLIGQTRVPSLQLGINAKERDVSGCVSYAGANQPLLPQNDPRVTFRNLFSEVGAPVDEVEKIRRRRASVLDAVLAQISSLKTRVGTAEKARLDAHFTKVRDLETRLTALPPGSCVTPSEPGALDFETEAAMPEVARLQIELMVLAFQCDLTRIATLMFSDAKNHIALPFLNINSDVHNLTHLTDPQVGVRDTWQAQQFASILSQLLHGTDAAGTSMLQSSLMFWGSDVSRGSTHSHEDMPFVVAGHAAGWRMGRYLTYGGLNHNNLLVSMLRGFGSTVSTFGDPAFCSGPLANLT